MPIVLTTNLPDLELVARGKVRDIYDLGKSLLIVTTDRISAFDVIMNEGIPDKGYVLTQISAFWFRQMEDIIPNHIISTEIKRVPGRMPKVRRCPGRAFYARQESYPPAGGVYCPRLHLGFRLEGLQGNRRHLRHQTPNRPCGIRQAGGADLHSFHKGRVGGA